MKGLVSLAVVVAFFVAIPQCFGQSQDAEKDASQLLEEQQLVQMFQLAMAPPTIASVPVSNLLLAPGCIRFCNSEFNTAKKACPKGKPGKACREAERDAYDNCTLCCHSSCNTPSLTSCFADYPEFCCETGRCE